MKRTHEANIGGLIFHVEIDAYERLEAYLESVRAYFASYPDHEEILSDIEGRIAEQLIDTSPNRIVTERDVGRVIGVMGRVDEFGVTGQTRVQARPASATREQSATAPPPESTQSAQSAPSSGSAPPRVDPAWSHAAPGTTSPPLPGTGTRALFRDPDHKVFAGVAAGIGAYFGVPPTRFRALFLLSTLFFFGSGLLVYLILWACVPYAKTISDKLRMHGHPVTLAAIEQWKSDPNLVIATYPPVQGGTLLLASIVFAIIVLILYVRFSAATF